LHKYLNQESTRYNKIMGNILQNSSEYIQRADRTICEINLVKCLYQSQFEIGKDIFSIANVCRTNTATGTITRPLPIVEDKSDHKISYTVILQCALKLSLELRA